MFNSNKFKYLKKIKSKTKKLNSKLKKLITIFVFLIVLFFILNKKKTISNNDNKKFKKKSNTKIAMCVISKTENKYIKYFLKHYIKLGFDHIYLYDNNDIEEEEPINS